jgi:hypothetical protein
MAITTIQVTGQTMNALDGTPLNGVIIFSSSVPILADTADHDLVEGSAPTTVTAGVMKPVTIPTTDSVTPTFTYTITLRLVTVDGAEGSPPPFQGVLIPSTLGATVDLTALV